MWVQTDRSTASSEPCGLPDRAVVVGIGTVGLHRALSLDRIGIDVTGYDIDETAVAAYRRGVDATGVIGDDDIAASDCTFTTDPDCIGDADAVFVAVPTNYDHETSASKHGQLDGDRARSEQRRGDGLAAVRAAAETIGGRLTPKRSSSSNRRFHRGDAGAVHAVAGGGVRVRSGSGVRRRSVAGPIFSGHAERGVSAADEARGSRGAGGGAVRCSAVRSGVRLGSHRRDPGDSGGRKVCRERLSRREHRARERARRRVRRARPSTPRPCSTPRRPSGTCRGSSPDSSAGRVSRPIRICSLTDYRVQASPPRWYVWLGRPTRPFPGG